MFSKIGKVDRLLSTLYPIAPVSAACCGSPDKCLVLQLSIDRGYYSIYIASYVVATYPFHRASRRLDREPQPPVFAISNQQNPGYPRSYSITFAFPLKPKTGFQIFLHQIGIKTGSVLRSYAFALFLLTPLLHCM